MSVALPEGEAPTPPLPAGRGPRREEVGLDGGRAASLGQGVPVCECMCECVFETERRDTEVGRAQGVQACEKKTNLEILTETQRGRSPDQNPETHTQCAERDCSCEKEPQKQGENVSGTLCLCYST